MQLRVLIYWLIHTKVLLKNKYKVYQTYQYSVALEGNIFKENLVPCLKGQLIM